MNKTLQKFITDPAKVERLIASYEKAVQDNRKALEDLLIAKNLKKSVEEWEAKIAVANQELFALENKKSEMLEQAEKVLKDADGKLAAAVDYESEVLELKKIVEKAKIEAFDSKGKLLSERDTFEKEKAKFEIEVTRMKEWSKRVGTIVETFPTL